jgi:hypothetical protein
MVDAELRKTFDRDGYVLLPGAIDRRPLDGVLAQSRELFHRQLSRHGGPVNPGAPPDAALLDLFRIAMPSYLAAAKLTQYLPSLHRLGVSDAVLGLLARLGIVHPVISTRPVMHIVAEELRVPGGYHRTPPHQDWRSVQGSLDAVVVWLPLVAAGSDAAPLEVIPGSHRRGLYPAQSDPFGNRVADGAVEDSDFRPICAVPGDAVVFSMFLVHRTGARQSSGVRWSASFRYNNLDEPSFTARDFPNPYIYRPREDLLVPDFPALADLQDIFGEE